MIVLPFLQGILYILFVNFIIILISSSLATTTMKVVGKHHYKQYTLKNVLGQGSFGKVYHSPPYAIKQMNMVGMPKYMTTALQNQVQILNRIQHPNVVKLVDSFQESGNLYLVMEYCEEDLANFLKRKKIDEKMAHQIFRQLILGFKELVSKGITHRDLKPANILVNAKGQFKLADFGFAKFVDHYDSKLLYSMVGTPIYMSPQILGKVQYTTKSDIWSLGIILYQMVCGTFPWIGISQQDLLKNIKSRPLAYPPHVSAYSKELINKMLKINQGQRIGWEQLFSVILPNNNLSPQKQRNQTSRQNKITNVQNKQNRGESPSRKRIFPQTPKKVQKQRSLKKIEAQNREKITSQNKIKINQGKEQNFIKLVPVKQTQVLQNKNKQNKDVGNNEKRRYQTAIKVDESIIKTIFLAEFQRLLGSQSSKSIGSKSFSQFNQRQKDQFYNVQQNFNPEFINSINTIFKVAASK